MFDVLGVYGLAWIAADLLTADDTSSASSLTLLRSRGGVAATTRMESHLVRGVDDKGLGTRLRVG